MPEQLTIFDTGIKCDHCKTDPGAKKEINSVVWNGFRDLDNGKRVCFKCKERHYHEKSLTDKKYLYSEVPIVIPSELLKK